MDENYPLSELVTVSRQWQHDLEPHIFARIRITPSRAVDFDSMTRRTNALVRYLWLCLELDEYTFGSLPFREEYFSPSDPECCRVGNEFLGNPFRLLFSALSTWNHRDDLTLDISIYSPSDWKHSFAYLSVLPDMSPKRLKGLGSDQPAAAEAGDPRHHPWRALYADIGVTLGHLIALKETFATMGKGPFDIETACAWWQQLPTVPVVSRLLLRQQNRRKWLPGALRHMFTRFSNLKELYYEPWEDYFFLQEFTDIGKLLHG